MMNLTDREIVRIFKALGDEKRVQILRVLLRGEKCACHLLEEIDVSQPTLSHHMKVLCDSGLVIGRKEGKWMHYSISREGAALAMETLRELTDAAAVGSACC